MKKYGIGKVFLKILDLRFAAKYNFYDEEKNERLCDCSSSVTLASVQQPSSPD